MDRLSFSSTLRTSVHWHCLEKSFPQNREIGITEVTNPNFDMCIESHVSKRTTMVRLIDQCVPMEKQISALDIWASQSTNGDRVVFVLSAEDSSGQLAFQTLQLGLLARHTPVGALMIPHIDQVIPTLLTYAGHNAVPSLSSRRDISSTELLSYAIASAPLNEHEARAIQQLCGSIEGLERESRKPEFEGVLSQVLHPSAVQAMIEFWKDECIK